MPKATITYPDNVVHGKKRKNAGWHPKGKRAYRAAKTRIIQCLTYYREPRLYHLILSGNTYRQHKKVLTALCQRLTRAKVEHEWFSARECNSERGEHLHIFVLVDADGSPPQALLNTYEDCWLAIECSKKGLNNPFIAAPKNEIHGENHYAQLPYLGPTNRATEKATDRLANAMEWLSYIYKARDKHDEEWENEGQIFSASRPKRNKTVAAITSSKPVVNGDVPIKIKTGDNLLDAMIGKMQHIYQLSQAQPRIALA
ncbi:hypothetical protein OU994_10400 [Pseudoduganella sp. SL102]|uniref:hypothetical protein n=1 Tax=Pseudoduganella sp. SL102 TaxID=2995154 RepID=UPI00248CDEE3|nr:hypothetical protein [Pseudoduganella sp. SL102]WBS04651.1 hypothetical protein OU994_10400 [Pseudoduganella sp. SL102]